MQVLMWGANEKGQLGIGKVDTRNSPKMVKSQQMIGERVVKVWLKAQFDT